VGMWQGRTFPLLFQAPLAGAQSKSKVRAASLTKGVCALCLREKTKGFDTNVSFRRAMRAEVLVFIGISRLRAALGGARPLAAAGGWEGVLRPWRRNGLQIAAGVICLLRGEPLFLRSSRTALSGVMRQSLANVLFVKGSRAKKKSPGEGVSA
jgi:hypothetical protein